MERGLFNVVAVFDGTVPLTLKFDAPSKGGMGSDPPASESHSLVFLEIKPSLQVSAWLDGLASCAPPPVPPEGALPESHRCAGGEEVPGEAVPPDPGHGAPPPVAALGSPCGWHNAGMAFILVANQQRRHAPLPLPFCHLSHPFFPFDLVGRKGGENVGKGGWDVLLRLCILFCGSFVVPTCLDLVLLIQFSFGTFPLGFFCFVFF